MSAAAVRAETGERGMMQEDDNVGWYWHGTMPPTQLPPQQPAEIEEEPITNVLDLRAADRKMRRYLTGKELMEILQTPANSRNQK